MDAVQHAESGHPGMPMGMPDIAVALWSRFLTVDPDDPALDDRDRFVLSNGHGSTLLYAVLHLAEFPVTLDDLRRCRQWGSPTAGHPEFDRTRGVEMTSGPLGQGFATPAGMAIAEEHLRAVVSSELADHRTFVFVSDSDLLEGLSSEAASMAGHLGLGRLVCFYDDNGVSIDGATSITFSEDVTLRFDSAGWQVLSVDGHDQAVVVEATEEALARGGHVLRGGDDVVLIATGSEAHVALEAAEILDTRGVSTRVVSLSCWEAFSAQTEQYRRSVLGVAMPRVSLEAAATFGWERITEPDGMNLGIDHFGASAPASTKADRFGFTPEQASARIVEWLG